jgi:hypothetical protein
VVSKGVRAARFWDDVVKDTEWGIKTAYRLIDSDPDSHWVTKATLKTAVDVFGSMARMQTGAITTVAQGGVGAGELADPNTNVYVKARAVGKIGGAVGTAINTVVGFVPSSQMGNLVKSAAGARQEQAMELLKQGWGAAQGLAGKAKLVWSQRAALDPVVDAVVNLGALGYDITNANPDVGQFEVPQTPVTEMTTRDKAELYIRVLQPIRDFR